MSKGIILGIDFSKNYTQMAYFDEEGIPQSISLGTEDNYLIPTLVCYNSDLKEWSAGEEAVNKGSLENSRLYDSLPELFSDESCKDIDEIMTTYMSYLLKIAINYCDGRLVKKILLTVEDVNPSIIEGLTKVFVELGYNDEDIKIISHSESFVYYALNQNKDIWVNQVYFLNFTEYDFSCRKLNVMKNKQIHVADVSVESLSDKLTFEEMKKDPKKADEIVAEYMEDQTAKHIVSGVYLSGEGFYEEGWEKTIAVLCKNRRVFKGNNLIVKGAVYGAREFFYTPVLEEYLISCKGRTRVKVTMEVKHNERDHFVTLSNIGDYWYQARSKVECILEEKTEACFEIHDIINRRNEKFKIDLSGFPKRPPKTTRIEVDFKYVNENVIEVEIKDLGFGEFFKATDTSVKKQVSIQ